MESAITSNEKIITELGGIVRGIKMNTRRNHAISEKLINENPTYISMCIWYNLSLPLAHIHCHLSLIKLWV